MNQNIVEHKELVKSNIATLYGVDLTQFEKGGEGSKGGKIIGHTKSGKPVYANKNATHKDYNDFTKEDHEDASVINVNYAKDAFQESKKRKDGGNINVYNNHMVNGGKHSNEASKLNKSQEEDTIEKGQTSDAFRYSDNSAFKLDLTGAEIKEKCKTAIPYLIAQKEALKEIAQDALNQCEGILPDDTRKDNNISYAVFSYDLREPKRDQYSNTYPEESDCQKQMGRYNSAIYQMLDINSDIKVLQTLANTLTDNKTYSLTLNQIVAISMGYTEDELAEKAIEVEIEKGGEGSRGGKIIGHTKRLLSSFHKPEKL